MKRLNLMSEFYKKHKEIIFLTVVAVVLLYWQRAFTTNVGIDTEQWIIGSYGKDWLLSGLGRFGHYYSAMMLNLGHYNPYVNGMMFLLIFICASLLWIYIFQMVSEKNNLYIVFLLLFLTSPLWAAQFYFTLQEAAIVFGLLCQGISFLLFFDVLLDKDKNPKTDVVKMVVSVICAIYAIGTYQSFFGLHIAEAAACLLLLFDRDVNEEKNLAKLKAFWKKAAATVIHFFVSYGGYWLLCKVMNWGTSNYLEVKWGKEPFGELVKGLGKDFSNLLLGKEAYAGWALLTSLVLCVILMVLKLARNMQIGIKISYIVLLIGNIFSMVVLHIAIGSVPADRARIPIAFGTAFLAMYTLTNFREISKRVAWTSIIGVVGVVLIFISGVAQMERMMTLYYTDDVCNSQQYAVGTDIVKQIEKLGGDGNSTVVMYGRWDAPLNPSCQVQAPVGISSFDWDYNSAAPTSGTRRAILYLRAAFGKSYNMDINENQVAEVVTSAESMPSYPADGYVQKVNDVFVVKLSNAE